MKTNCMSLLVGLTTLLFFTTLPCAAESQSSHVTHSDSHNSLTSIEIGKSAQFKDTSEVTLINVMVNLLDTVIEYDLNDSTVLVLAYNPFANQLNDAHHLQPASNLSVGLKVSF